VSVRRILPTKAGELMAQGCQPAEAVGGDLRGFDSAGIMLGSGPGRN
jgi:hypothetical protein